MERDDIERSVEHGLIKVDATQMRLKDWMKTFEYLFAGRGLIFNLLHCGLDS
jgi:hypothetical protein